MMGMHPFDTMMGFGHQHPHEYRMPRQVRQPPRSAPPARVQPSAARAEPTIDLTERDDHYQISMSSPAGHAIRNARANLDDDTLMLQGALVDESDGYIEYVTRRRAGIYSAPHQQALVGVVPAGERVLGRAPTRDGWIAIEEDDEEGWMIDDGSLGLTGRRSAPSRGLPFAKRVSLPADADLRAARSQSNGRGGLLITVPRKLQHRANAAATRQVPVNVKRTPPTTTNAKKAAAATKPSVPATKPAAASPPPHYAAAGAAKDADAEAYKNAHKRKAAERRANAQPSTTSLAEELASLHGLEYAGPVLSEVESPHAGNVQSPTERCEEWVATADGGFVRGEGLVAQVMREADLARTSKKAREGHGETPSQESEVESEDDLSYWGF